MVAPIAPGGSTDYLARAVAQHLSDRTGQSVIVDNRPGAGGNIGTDLVAKAPPDGYTLVCSNVSSVAINVSLYKSMPYDPAKDLAPITMVAVFPNVIVTQASFPAKTIKELIALAKAKPGQLTFASAGSGSSTHLGPELLNTMAGIGLRHVPYRGGGPALVAVMANEVSLYFSSIVAATGHIQTGRLSALGVTSLQRWSTLPNIPTVAESGFPGFEALNWSGILAPAATPNSVVAFLNREIVSGLRSKEMVAQLMSQGARATPMNPEEFRQYIAAEILKWAKVVKASGASAN